MFDPINLPSIVSIEQAIQEAGENGRGLMLGRGDADYAYGATAPPMPDALLMTDEELDRILTAQEVNQTSLYHKMRQAGLPAKNQARLPYCWVFAPVHAIEVIGMLAGQPYVSLSPASAGAQIKNFRAVGGWGLEALQWLAEFGCDESAHWPDTSLDRSLLTEESKARALNHRVTEWMELPRRSKRHWMSCVAQYIPVPAGYDEWEHEVLIVGATKRNGVWLPIFRNQWKGYGDDNYAVGTSSWAQHPDDQVAPRVKIAA